MGSKDSTLTRAIEILNEITTGHVCMELLKIPKNKKCRDMKCIRTTI